MCKTGADAAKLVKRGKTRYNDHRMAKSIENSIDFVLKIIRPMLIAMSIWQNSHAVLLRSKAARRKAFSLFAII